MHLLRHTKNRGQRINPIIAAVEPAGGGYFLVHRGQKELTIRPVETGGEEVGTLAGIEVDHRVAGKGHVALDLRGTEPRNQPRHRVDQGRLAAPRTSDEPHRLAAPYMEVEVTEDRPRFPTETNRESIESEPSRDAGT